MAEEVKYLIIGGGIAGTTAAQTIREKDKESRILIVSDEPYRLYSRVMLSKPNFFLGQVPFDSVFLKTPEWYEVNKIELLTNHKAGQLNPQNQIITLDDGKSLHYQKLLLAIGGVSRKLDFPGKDLEGIYYLRTLDDVKKILERVRKAKTAVTVGGGFIGLEISEAFQKAGLQSIFLIREPYFWAELLDPQGSLMIENALQKAGVQLFKNEELSEALGERELQGIKTKSGKTYNCELMVLGIGVTTPAEFLKPSGLNIEQGIVANEYLETNLSNVWVAGDCAKFTDVILEEKFMPQNWSNAQMQGKVAGHNMMGQKEVYKMVSCCTTQGPDFSLTTVGSIKADEGKQVINCLTQTPPSYARLILKAGKIKGAILINRASELPTVSKLILEGKDVLAQISSFQDPNFDLKALIS